jgi:hypothetical protein
MSSPAEGTPDSSGLNGVGWLSPHAPSEHVKGHRTDKNVPAVPRWLKLWNVALIAC